MSTPTDAPAAKKGGKKKIVMLAVPLLLVVGGAGYWFLLRDPGPPPEPVAGEVIRMDPMQINLADGHYLKLGLALQASAEVHSPVDGAAIQDAAIAQFTGKTMAELSTPEAWETHQELLMEHAHEVYHGDVLDVFRTEFVMQ